MIQYRDRRRRGYKCYIVEVSDADVDALIARCLLDRLRRHDPAAIQEAIRALLDAMTRHGAKEEALAAHTP
jgi:hypothetical protein